MMYAKLAVPEAPPVKVWRRLVEILRADLVLRRVVATWWVWDGSEVDQVVPTVETCPSIGLGLTGGSDEWLGPSGFQTDLVVAVDLLVAGTRVDDAVNLLYAVKSALYPADPARRLAVQQGLVAAGALTGEAVFSGKWDAGPDPSGAMMTLTSQFRLSLDELRNP